jgi:hypothetical protein
VAAHEDGRSRPALQGNAALPLAFWLQRRMGWGALSPDNPLRPLSIQLAMSQIAALPMALMAVSLAPATTGVAIASMAAGHLVPYAVAGWMLYHHARALGRTERGAPLSCTQAVLQVKTADKPLDVV